MFSFNVHSDIWALSSFLMKGKVEDIFRVDITKKQISAILVRTNDRKADPVVK